MTNASGNNFVFDMDGGGQMITLYGDPVALVGGVPAAAPAAAGGSSGADAATGSIAGQILAVHSPGGRGGSLKITFDALISHDITYVGIVQTARASGMTGFPVPYALTNCHNSLCAVGGTINEDDHVFGLSAAKKYGGIYIPANQAVIHQYAREALAASGQMILGSDSHTRYGALGTLGIGEGGPELVKQLLNNTYDLNAPEVVLVWLDNAPPHGVGPHDIAIALCGAVYGNGFASNKILEFAGPGIAALPMDYRFGIDVMTTETACLSSVWRTDDDTVPEFYKLHGRAGAYKPLAPAEGARYDAMIIIDLAKAEPMIAMPFHPSMAYTLSEMKLNAPDILREAEREAAGQFGGKVNLSLTGKAEGGRLMTDQGIIAGCAGGMYENIREAAAILDGASVGDGYFSLSIYPSSMPVNLRLIDDGVQGSLIRAGALFKPCFCGPCFGAGDVPSNNGFSIRHTTRNFINREGSRPGDGQLAAVALMDARSIAATAKNGGQLTSAADIEYESPSGGTIDDAKRVFDASRVFDQEIYKNRVYNGFGNPEPGAELVMGPNIADWPKIDPLGENLLLRLASVILDPVTTTDELIPSGETSSYRSNPIKLAEFALSRRDPQYVGRAKATRALEAVRVESVGSINLPAEALAALDAAQAYLGKAVSPSATQIASAVYAHKPGDGSAREQAASCQRVLGGGANICREYATKRYRSNLINWGMLPFTLGSSGAEAFEPEVDDWIYIQDVRGILARGASPGESQLEFDTYHIKSAGGADSVKALPLRIDALTDEERDIILQGCLMNYYAAKNQ